MGNATTILSLRIDAVTYQAAYLIDREGKSLLTDAEAFPDVAARVRWVVGSRRPTSPHCISALVSARSVNLAMRLEWTYSKRARFFR